MNLFTSALMEDASRQLTKRKGFFSGWVAKNAYYQAQHLQKDVKLLWMEAKRFGVFKCYPCALETDEELRVYHTLFTVDTKEENQKLIHRWTELVHPDTFVQEYSVQNITFSEFNRAFDSYQQRESGAAQKKWEDTVEPSALLRTKETPRVKPNESPEEMPGQMPSGKPLELPNTDPQEMPGGKPSEISAEDK